MCPSSYDLGEHLRTVFREGDGPGEFRNASELAFMPDGNIGVMEMMPGMNNMLPKGGVTEGQERQLKRFEACIDSMTPKERRHPQLLNGSRKKRIARGSGTSVEEINRLLRQYGQMRKLMKRLGKADARTLKRQLGIR